MHVHTYSQISEDLAKMYFSVLNESNHDYIFLSYSYNQIVPWCHLIPNLDNIKVFHSCAGLEGLKFWRSLIWDSSRNKYGFKAKMVQEHPVNYPKRDEYDKVVEKVRKCRQDIYNRWYQQFNKVQKDIIQVVNTLQNIKLHMNNSYSDEIQQI